MIIYKSPDGGFHGIESEIFEGILPPGSLPATAAEVASLPGQASPIDALRAERDVRLASALAILDRHRNQADFGFPTTLTQEQAVAWAAYAQALRDLPDITDDPAAPVWPEVPQ